MRNAPNTTDPDRGPAPRSRRVAVALALTATGAFLTAPHPGAPSGLPTDLPGVRTAIADDDLSPLSDEFEDSTTIANFARVETTEGWNTDQLRLFDVDTVRDGSMTMVPYTCTWYQDYRGPLAYKLVSGDFVVTTALSIDDMNPMDADNLPASLFSLAGIMIRTPRAITPSTWVAGSMQDDATNTGENYVFLSLGYGTNALPLGNGGAPVFQTEVKTTRNSNSQLALTTAPARSAELQVARIGSAVIVLVRFPGGNWTVHRRYARPDLPQQLQAGLCCYTDYAGVLAFTVTPFNHNSVVITTPLSAPDLSVTYDYLRFVRPVVPANLSGLDLTNAGTVSDTQLLSFLGDAANLPHTGGGGGGGGGGDALRVTPLSGRLTDHTRAGRDRVDLSALLASTDEPGTLPDPAGNDFSVSVGGAAVAVESGDPRWSVAGMRRTWKSAPGARPAWKIRVRLDTGSLRVTGSKLDLPDEPTSPVTTRVDIGTDRGIDARTWAPRPNRPANVRADLLLR